jgi:Ca2+-binding RTX toxin-like protein
VQVNEGLDTITDFDRTQGDKLQFVGVNFATLALGPLASSQFVANNTGLAKTLDHHFIFNTATRILSYDMDGSGSAAAVQIAKLNVSKLIASDFEIVAS